MFKIKPLQMNNNFMTFLTNKNTIYRVFKSDLYKLNFRNTSDTQVNWKS